MKLSSAELAALLDERFKAKVSCCDVAVDEVTIEVAVDDLLDVCQALKEEAAFQFEQLIDLCGVDYLHYGQSDWETLDATHSGFSRGAQTGIESPVRSPRARFASVVHLLSISLNHRLRIRTFVPGEPPIIPSLTSIWRNANWYERESFDLYGILYDGHTDLRRILTDYGFVGHPFRKDFPVSGHVEMVFDEQQHRCKYQPVSIEPRVLVPKVIRKAESQPPTSTAVQQQEG